MTAHFRSSEHKAATACGFGLVGPPVDKIIVDEPSLVTCLRCKATAVYKQASGIESMTDSLNGWTRTATLTVKVPDSFDYPEDIWELTQAAQEWVNANYADSLPVVVPPVVVQHGDHTHLNSIPEDCVLEPVTPDPGPRQAVPWNNKITGQWSESAGRWINLVSAL